MSYLTELAAGMKAAKRSLMTASTEQKNAALLAIADGLERDMETILAENAKDLSAARENGMSESMCDRLALSEARIRSMADACRVLTEMEDPIGRVLSTDVRPNGLMIKKVTVPLGCIGMIYEARPNVTIDAGVLCIKSGNAVMLRGGKEAVHSNRILSEVMRDAMEEVGLPRDCVVFVEKTDRETAGEMMKLNGYLDVLIPRGGAGLIQSVVKNATVPVIETGVGNCHVYVDDSADLEMAVRIVDNAKTSRPSVCNAAETLLVHKDVAEDFLPMIRRAFDDHHVTLYGCKETRRILGDSVLEAGEEEYAKEFLDYAMAVRVVADYREAVDHIIRYSTGHSEAIVTTTKEHADYFTKEIDSAAVYVNASTRFTDGGEFGFGAEIGISTQKLHARGPFGMAALTSYKYVIEGNGQIR